MELQTQIPLKKASNQIDYQSQLLLLGSCFSENIGKKLDYFKYQSVQNPFGILFHPKAIENLVERAIYQKQYSDDEIFFQNERWHCFDAHSDISDVSKENLLKNLNLGLETIQQQIKRSTHIIITLGTAWVYRDLKTDSFVANCHKVPQKEFSKELLPVEDLVKSLENTMKWVRSINKKNQFIFTISPVRHLKDGFIENQRSKAHLITAIHRFVGKGVTLSEVEGYFPSYEIMMDELRDYRFYESDMVHPNKLAIEYIWEKFKQVWISENSYPIMDQVEVIQKGLAHRSFHPNSEQHRQFLKSLQEKITYLQQAYPHMKFER